MAEGESDYHYNWRTGEVYRCYWGIRIWMEYLFNDETSLPVSERECLFCSLEKCLECTNYIPSTKTYPEREQKKVKSS